MRSPRRCLLTLHRTRKTLIASAKVQDMGPSWTKIGSDPLSIMSQKMKTRRRRRNARIMNALRKSCRSLEAGGLMLGGSW